MANINKLNNEEKFNLIKKLIKDVNRLEITISGPEFIKLTKIEQVDMVEDLEVFKEKLEMAEITFKDLVLEARDESSKLYLTEVIEIEKPIFGSNNLILSPVGSGKTTLITDKLIDNIEQKVLLLVSNTALKDEMVPPNNIEARIKSGNRMFTTANREIFGKPLYSIHVMTYAEFGKRISANNDFLEDITQIFCDEIHSLIEYCSFGEKTNEGLIIARRFLLNPMPGIQVFYFTATDDYINQLKSKSPGSMKYVETFNYLNYPNIRKYVPLVSREFSKIEQTRQYLKDISESFDYYDYKGFAYCRTIRGLKVIEEMVIEEGFNPLVIWSTNNDEYDLSEEQLRAREELLVTGIIPAPYNFLIFNAALREGWNLKDPKVKIAILDTTNNTEHIQALGRLRRNVDLLVYRTNCPIKDPDIVLPESLLNVELTTEDKENLCDNMKLVQENGRQLKWNAISKLIEASGYIITESRKRIDGKQLRVSVITKRD